MAIAFAGIRGNVGLTTATNANISIPLGSPTSIVPGNTLIMAVYALNNASNSPSILPGAVVTDPRGNTWVAEVNQSSATSGGPSITGGLLQVYRCLVIFPYLAGDNLQIFSTLGSLQALFQINEFSGVSQGVHAVFSGTSSGVNATGSTPATVSTSAAGQLVIGFGGVDTTNAITGDSDTLDGSWSSVQTSLASFGTLTRQYKILSSFTSSPQSWQQTWTSSGLDNAYAQLVLTYDPLSPNGSPIAQNFPPQDNPNYSCPDTGFEPMPNGSALVPVDTGTAYQIEHTLPNYSVGTHYYSAVVQYDNTETAAQQHHIAYDLYQKGAEVPQDTVTQLVFPVSAVTLAGADVTTQLNGSTVSNAFAVQALQASGGYYLRFDGTPAASGGSYTPQINVGFDLYNTTGLGTQSILYYANSRIVRLGIRFTGWKDDSSTTAVPVGEGLQFSFATALGTPSQVFEVELGAWLLPDYQRSATEQTRWFGEINPIPRVPNSLSFYGGASSIWFRTPPDAGVSWTYADLLQLARDPSGVNPNGTDSISIRGLCGADFSQTITYLDKVELIVEVAPERRLGNCIHNVSTLPQYSFSPLGAASYSPGRAAVIPMRATIDESNILTVGTPNDWVLSAREALPASTSDYYPALATAPKAPQVGGVLLNTLAPNIPYNLPQANGIQLYTPQEAVGPSLSFLGYTQPRNMSPNQRPLVKRTVVDGELADTGTLMTQFELSFGALDSGNYLVAGSLFPVFQGLAPLAARQVYNGLSQSQKFIDGPNGTGYSSFRIVCKPDPLTTANLTFTMSTGTTGGALVTVAEALAGEQIGGGWYAVTKTFSHFSAGGTNTVTFSSTTPSTAPWQIAAVQSIGPSLPLSFEPLAPQNTAQGQFAYPFVMECPLSSVSVTLSTVTATVVPPNHNSCLAATQDVPTLTLNNAGSYSRIIVERSLGNSGPWTVVARLVGATDGTRVIDYEAPWDSPQMDSSLNIYYRTTGYRDSDRDAASPTISGPWAGSSVSPGAAFGLSCNELGVTVLYSPQDSGDLQLTWQALNPVQTIPLHMQDYQYSLRIPENRGLSITQNVEVNQFGACLIPTSAGYPAYLAEMLAYYGEKIGSGRYAMTPRPYEVALLPVFNSPKVWTLKLPGGHTRKVTLTVGDMTVTTINGMYLSSITMTDVTPLSSDPYDGS